MDLNLGYNPRQIVYYVGNDAYPITVNAPLEFDLTIGGATGEDISSWLWELSSLAEPASGEDDDAAEQTEDVWAFLADCGVTCERM